MSSLTLLVITDSDAPFLPTLSNRDPLINWIIASDPETLRSRAPEADAIIYAATKPGSLVTTLPFATRTQWIHSLWTGVEGILGPELLQHPAALTNGRGVFRWPLADWVAGVMLHFAFDLGRVIRQQQQGVWQPFISTSLKGRTLGIVGYGAIGSAAAARARVFGMKIAAVRRRPELFEGDALIDHGFAPGDLKEMLAISDYVLVATPLTAETRSLIGEKEFGAMKPSAILINIGRGPVVDESALVRALESAALRGAALDVFTNEPLSAGHPFWKMPQVLLSPHTADRVEGFLEPAFSCFLENLKRFQDDAPLLNVVDKQAGY